MRRAREWLRTFLGDKVAKPQTDDALLVISELVTNALRHGLGDVVVRASVDDAHRGACVGHRLGRRATAVAPAGSAADRWRGPAHRRRDRRLVGSVAVPGRQDGVGRHRSAEAGVWGDVRSGIFDPTTQGGTTVSATVLWIIAAVLVIVGIITLISGSIIWGIVLIVLGLLVGPGGVSIFRPRTGVR